jgi:chromosome partitioning protein
MILSFAILKGGDGKTMFNTNIAAALAMKKFKVLLIDCDAQANASMHLGITEAENTIYELLKNKADFDDSIIELSRNFHLIPASINLNVFNLDNKGIGINDFKNTIQPLESIYDIIIIDISPGVSMLNASVYNSVDQFIIPVTPGVLSLKGLNDFKYHLEIIRNKPFKPLGVAFNRFDPRRNLDSFVWKEMRKNYSVFNTAIRQNIKLMEAVAAGKSIFDYDPKCNGSIDLMKLAKEVVKRVKKYL